MRSTLRTVLLAIGLLVAACAQVPETGETTQNLPADHLHGFSASRAIEDQWFHVRLRRETEYRLAAVDHRVAIRAEGAGSASGLFRYVSVDPARCPVLEWSWRVDLTQPTADITTKEGDDVAASIFILFGDPGMLSSPNEVPTLRYVFTNGRAEPGTIVDNPYAPGVVRNVVIRGADAPIGHFVTEIRDVDVDYRAAFGSPPAVIEAIALFTDNDQTDEPVVAFYEYANFLCGS